MLDRNAFMETLRAVAELTRTAQNGLSKEEILKYFEGMDLSEEHVEMIYQYLQLPPEAQTGEPEKEEEEEVIVEEESQEENVYFQKTYVFFRSPDYSVVIDVTKASIFS